jgi:hypothetical protein
LEFRKIIAAATLLLAPGLLNAQYDFKLVGRNVQIHSFSSEGSAYTNDGNYLTMNTSRGSFRMTDGGSNMSTQRTDELRMSAQIYDRNIGHPGTWKPQLDLAVADYKLKDWLGVRGGVAKTTFGLNNDPQDAKPILRWRRITAASCLPARHRCPKYSGQMPT